MKRREFVATLAFAATGMPVRALAQQVAKTPVIGFLGATTPALAAPWISAFEQRLRELGWVEGRTVKIEYRWAEAESEQYARIATQFVDRKVDIIVTWASAPVLAAKQATSIIPIVFAAQMDPVGAGVVASMARPGGNVTGLSLQQTDTAGKRLELLQSILPSLRRLAVMNNPGAAGAALEAREIRADGTRRGLDVIAIEIEKADDVARAINKLAGRADALYVASDPLIFTNRVRINALAQDARLPTIYGSREYVDAGALLSYGPNFSDLFRRAADYVDKILRGAKPADLPVEQPIRFDLVVNLKAAKALGLTIPPSLLATANEVIE